MEIKTARYVAQKLPYTAFTTWEFYKHRHVFWEFVICVQGSAVHTVNANDYELSKGHILIMKPDSFHDYKITGEGYAHFDYYASSQNIKRAFDSANENVYKCVAAEKQPILLAVDLHTLNMLKVQLNRLSAIQTAEQYKESALTLYRTVLNFICGIAAENYQNKTSANPAWLTELFAVMSQPGYMSKNLSDVVAQTNFSHGHLCRLFKKHTGSTLLDYFTKMKIDYATMLLRTKKMSVLDISSYLGYGSVSHFIKLFKKYIGITPQNYRNSLRAVQD